MRSGAAQQIVEADRQKVLLGFRFHQLVDQPVRIRIGLVGSTEIKMDVSILDEVVEQLRGMPQSLQKQVLESTLR